MMVVSGECGNTGGAVVGVRDEVGESDYYCPTGIFNGLEMNNFDSSFELPGLCY